MISWCFPILVCGGLAIYGFVNDKTIRVDLIWTILFIALPLIIGCIFDVKSKNKNQICTKEDVEKALF